MIWNYVNMMEIYPNDTGSEKLEVTQLELPEGELRVIGALAISPEDVDRLPSDSEELPAHTETPTDESTSNSEIEKYFLLNEELMTPSEVAKLLRVHPRTVTRWARAGKLQALRTPGGHRRYFRSNVIEALDSANPQHDAVVSDIT